MALVACGASQAGTTSFCDGSDIEGSRQPGSVDTSQQLLLHTLAQFDGSILLDFAKPSLLFALPLIPQGLCLFAQGQFGDPLCCGL